MAIRAVSLYDKIIKSQKDLNKKYGITAIIACVIIFGILAIIYSNHTSQTSSVVTNKQPNSTNSAITAIPPTTTGRHFFAGVNETIKVATK